MLTVGSLFSGIGGLELGLERTSGFKTIFQVEINPYCSEVLKKDWSVPNYGDIKTIDWSKVERPDVLCGGFPCQDISVAGKGKGIKEGTRSGLWFEYLKAVRSLQPRYVVVENVSEITNRGLDTVLAGFAETGYNAKWFPIRASDVGANHRRERLFIIAFPNGERRERLNALRERRTQTNGAVEGVSTTDFNEQQRNEIQEKQPNVKRGVNATNTNDAGNTAPKRATNADREKAVWERQPLPRPSRRAVAPNRNDDGALRQAPAEARWRGLQAKPHDNTNVTDLRSQRVQREQFGKVRRFPEFSWCENVRRIEDLFNRTDIPQPLVRGTRNGVPSRLDNYIRRERTKALGNAVVPQVAQIVGEMILQMEADK
jgi:DNA-cytosine methyltransferase